MKLAALIIILSNLHFHLLLVVPVAAISVFEGVLVGVLVAVRDVEVYSLAAASGRLISLVFGFDTAGALLPLGALGWLGQGVAAAGDEVEVGGGVGREAEVLRGVAPALLLVAIG